MVISKDIDSIVTIAKPGKSKESRVQMTILLYIGSTTLLSYKNPKDCL